ncbi:hypothetical protein [Chelativorans salis]|uniref:Transcriptional regulator n=1 Tax=Chelativorans salis TaxID=2978478 RepID=A0ABT2LKU5_9HYPH|nr:hypothetical protein [Chelativorans sp. EGI FJ00035]MCT7375215.1 hypothetical protein [Chelativorans sp. EGI FJ00035]
MTQAITKDTLFPPTKPNAATKAEITNRTARAIIDAEAARRDAKTERLRQARLEMEAGQPKPAPAKARGRKTAAKASRRAG